ncbi:peptidase A4 family-domain-containing protein [Leptodontidium sp. 2 PMI_412]|nr:peptidase A4 family-domain-containing protein [Leptodontidium sp. MPI-SDFR-AT-0119]KAH9218210.1 peptidase A4 family-domain-containing protein [Leptodontidium sp. 2 PMI_412]
MKFSILSTLLLTGSAIAAPGTALRRSRAQARKSNPINRINKPELTNITEVSYSSNWAGAVLVGTGYTSVTGTFTVPSPTSAGSGSAWVGIDGDTCGTAILQTGVDWTRSGSKITYDAWYEWYPDYAYDFSGITISAGDVITVTVTATSKTAGTAIVKNVTTGKSVTHTFSNEASLGSLCEYNAEWIVEDFESGGSLVSFANFGTVAFTGASAVKSGSTVGVTGAEIIDIEQGSTILTDCSLVGTSGVTCTYV